MNSDAQSILEDLQRVAHERGVRERDPQLGLRVRAVKAFQHARFEHTYADILAGKRYAKAARFFLDELYGPKDFTRRDDQFARVVPALVRLFPKEIVRTVAALAQLHGLSEHLDTATARALSALPVDEDRYASAWQEVGQPLQRQRQVELTNQVGLALDAYTRNPLLRHSLRLMRAPAKAAGLSELQKFLETGFDTFRELRGARPFLDIIVSRETAFAKAMFEAPGAATRPRTRRNLDSS